MAKTSRSLSPAASAGSLPLEAIATTSHAIPLLYNTFQHLTCDNLKHFQRQVTFGKFTQAYTMLSRSPTKISLTQADIAAFEQRKAANDAMKAQQFDSSQDTTESLLEHEDSPAAVNAARRKQARERRMGLK